MVLPGIGAPLGGHIPELTSAYLHTVEDTALGASKSLSINLGDGATLLAVTYRHIASAGISPYVDDLQIDGVPTVRLRHRAFNIYSNDNARGTLEWHVLETSSKTGAALTASGPNNFRMRAFVWELNRLPFLFAEGGFNEGSTTTDSIAEAEVATEPGSTLFGLQHQGYSVSTAPTRSGFTDDAGPVSLAGTQASSRVWVGRNTTPANPQLVSISSVNAATHLVDMLVLS